MSSGFRSALLPLGLGYLPPPPGDTGVGASGVVYSARAYNAYGWPLGWLRLVSVDAGRVVNGVADAEVVAVGPFAGWWRDVSYVDVWRYSRLGQVGRWACYMVRGWNERYDNGKTVYAFRCMGLAKALDTRPSTIATPNQWIMPIRLVAKEIIYAALGSAPTSLPIVTLAIAGPQETITLKLDDTGALSKLQTLLSASRAQELPDWMNFDVYPIIQSDMSLGLGVAVWAGEYGADRRVSSGALPLVLWPKALVDRFEANRDESGIVTVVKATGGASLATNATWLENPYGNYWAVGDSSSGADATANARATIWKQRPVTKLALSLSVDVDKLGLGLGDVMSVVYGSTYVDGRANVMHARWTSEGEQMEARIDIEVA